MFIIHLLVIVAWASSQMRCFVGCACTGNVFPASDFKRNSGKKLLVSDPDMQHGTCVMHGGIVNPRWRGKCSQRMRNPQFYVSGKKPIASLEYRQSWYWQWKRRFISSLRAWAQFIYICIYMYIYIYILRSRVDGFNLGYGRRRYVCNTTYVTSFLMTWDSSHGA